MMMTHFYRNLVGLLVIAAGCPFANIPAGAQPTNVRIFPSTIPQTEPVITVQGSNPQIMFASSRTISGGFQSEGVYVTTNAGLSWFGSDTCKGEPIQNHGGDPGVAIHPNGTFIITHIGSVFRGLYSHTSTNQGTAWSNAATIFYQDTQPVDDKGQTTALDDSPASPYFGRTYAAWAVLGSPFTLLSSFSTNAGQSWSTPVTINPSPPARCSGSYVAVGENGKVYVCWAGLEVASPFIEDFVGLAVSTNGGVNWRVTQNAYDMNGIKGNLPAKSNILVNGLPQLAVDLSGGQRNGWLYLVTTEKNLSPAGSDPDIILHRSTDDGLTWSAGIRVNGDPLNNGKVQYFPAIDVDYQGGINIVFYDDRNTSTDSSEIMLARSVDGGNSWTETVISAHRFKPKPIAGFPSGYQGDHIGVKSVQNMLYAFWMDDFSGTYQIWMAPVDLNAVSVTEKRSYLPETLLLEQNFPNPFNPTTKIRFAVPAGADNPVRLCVYDVLGRDVVTLVNGTITPGYHEEEFDASPFPSGIYFVRLSAAGQSVARKIVLLK